MIEIIKAENISYEEFNSQVEAFNLFDDNKLAMICIFEMQKNKVKILDIKELVAAPLFYYDGMLRTLAAYGVGKGVGLLYSKNNDLFDILLKMKFEYVGESKMEVKANAETLLAHACK